MFENVRFNKKVHFVIGTTKILIEMKLNELGPVLYLEIPIFSFLNLRDDAN